MAEIKNKKLVELTQAASRHATEALAKLTGSNILVQTAKMEITNVQKKVPVFGPETIVVGIYLPISGDVRGAALLIFPQPAACQLCDLLLKRAPNSTHILSELDKSALKEVGNIICGSYLTIFSNALMIKLVENVPEFSQDMFGAIVDVILTGFAREGENALIIEVEFIFEQSDIKGYVALVFGLQEMNIIVKALGLTETERES